MSVDAAPAAVGRNWSPPQLIWSWVGVFVIVGINWLILTFGGMAPTSIAWNLFALGTLVVLLLGFVVAPRLFTRSSRRRAVEANHRGGSGYVVKTRAWSDESDHRDDQWWIALCEVDSDEIRLTDTKGLRVDIRVAQIIPSTDPRWVVVKTEGGSYVEIVPVGASGLFPRDSPSFRLRFVQ